MEDMCYAIRRAEPGVDESDLGPVELEHLLYTGHIHTCITYTLAKLDTTPSLN